MAMLRFIIYDLDEASVEVKSVISFELSKDISAACDGLRLTFYLPYLSGEINRIEIFDGDKKIFNGYCDTQRESISSDGMECFIYARSSACILVDNEALPFTYNCPSARTLFLKNAKDFGFEYALPEIYCDSSYQVSKGSSCFAAINNFVYGITGQNMMINVNNELVLPDSNNNINLDNFDIISEKRIINRGNAVTAVDYKAYNENEYAHHIKSRFFDSKKINRTVKLNISSLPEWQRDYTLVNTLKSAASSYDTMELLLDGCKNIPLYCNIKYTSRLLGVIEDYYISSVCIISDKKGERTRLTLSKNIDLKEITYVAK